MIEVLFFANFHIWVLAFPVERARAHPDSVHSSKDKVKTIFSSRRFLQNTNERILLYYYETSGRLVLVCFLEEI